MSMVFPGMDPYLEDPQIWPGVHGRLIVYIADALQPLLRPRYITGVEERVFVEGPDREIIPDLWLRQSRSSRAEGAVAFAEGDVPVIVRVPSLEVHETYVTILDRQSGFRVVTVIEVVSPSNKFAGPGRRSYIDKQQEIIASETHLVEIDLLRTGPHVLAVTESAARGRGEYDYLISVNRAGKVRDVFELYPRLLRQLAPNQHPTGRGGPRCAVGRAGRSRANR